LRHALYYVDQDYVGQFLAGDTQSAIGAYIAGADYGDFLTHRIPSFWTNEIVRGDPAIADGLL